MNDCDPKLLEKLENLEGIEARLARQEKKARITLVGGYGPGCVRFRRAAGPYLEPAVNTSPPLNFIPQNHQLRPNTAKVSGE